MYLYPKSVYAGLLVLLLTLLPVLGAQAQCSSLARMFAALHNRSEAEVLSTLKADKKEFYEVQSQRLPNYWDKPDYLQGDSVKRARITYKQRYLTCFGKQEVEVSLLFADDKLFDVTVQAFYPVKDKAKGQAQFQELKRYFEQPVAQPQRSLSQGTAKREPVQPSDTTVAPVRTAAQHVLLTYDFEPATLHGPKALREEGKYVLQVTSLDFSHTKLDIRSYE